MVQATRSLCDCQRKGSQALSMPSMKKCKQKTNFRISYSNEHIKGDLTLKYQWKLFGECGRNLAEGWKHCKVLSTRVCFVSFPAGTFQSQSNLTCPSISLLRSTKWRTHSNLVVNCDVMSWASRAHKRELIKLFLLRQAGGVAMTSHFRTTSHSRF